MIPPRILLAGLACLCPFTLAQKLKSDPHKTLIIISTSDMHGNLEKFPKLATLVKQYRAKYPHVLLVDSGDYSEIISWATPMWTTGKNGANP